jgi:hypothetical protein
MLLEVEAHVWQNEENFAVGQGSKAKTGRALRTNFSCLRGTPIRRCMPTAAGDCPGNHWRWGASQFELVV